ncbi:subtilisin family serine protease [Crossiella equi]|uniref:Subtilisin family serine protease n=1 Tax=Crossiella equi TaxID=130796 RepID=A0ABS5AC97_9PSEU|nr:S8 family serine peptidase [Crossiella equi]MBP2474202.1 subtilisin family serine protease [Crossiella equi]
MILRSVAGLTALALLVPAAPAVAAPADCAPAEFTFTALFAPYTPAASAERQVTAQCGTTLAYHPEIGVAVVNADAAFDTRFGVDRAVSAAKTRRDATGAGALALAEEPPDRTGEQWDMRQLRVPEAHQVTTGRREVVVGVLDTGVDGAHPELKGAFAPELSAGCDTGKADPRPEAWGPKESHGTGVAGVLASAADGKGITGVAPGVRIASVQVMRPSDGYIDPEGVVCGFMWAAQHRFTLTNGSWSSGPFAFLCADRVGEKVAIEAITRAVRFAHLRGVLHVASAGNFATDLTNPAKDPLRPEGQQAIDRNCRMLPNQLPEVVTVSATGYEKRLAGYSDFGAGVVSVTAPSGDRAQVPPVGEGPAIALSLVPGGGYGGFGGTSGAAPKVTGVLALLASRHGRVSPSVLKSLLVRTAVTPLPCPAGDARCTTDTDGRTNFYGYGMADAAKAVRA